MATVRIYDSFDALPAAYEPLFAEAGAGSFFLSLPWFSNLAATALENDERPALYGVEADDAAHTPLALLPMKIGSASDTFRGRGICGLSTYYSPIFSPLVPSNAGREAEVLGALVRALKADRPRWDYIDLRPLDRDAALFSRLIATFKWAGLVVQTYFSSANWYLEVAGRSYEAYSRDLPSKLLNTVKRKSRKFEQLDGGRIEITTGGDNLDAAISAYETVYLASWKVPEPFPKFSPGLIRTCAEEGCLRLGIVYLDDEPIAAQLWITSGKTASIFKLAYDERQKKLSAGSILSSKLMEHALDVDKVDVVDYLTGDEPYKQDWMSHRRERWGIVAFNPRTTNGLIEMVRHVGGRVLKNALTTIGRKRA